MVLHASKRFYKRSSRWLGVWLCRNHDHDHNNNNHNNHNNHNNFNYNHDL